jgi:hypothetical protein
VEIKYGQITNKRFVEAFVNLTSSNDLATVDKVQLYHMRKKIAAASDDFRAMIKQAPDELQDISTTVIPEFNIEQFPLTKALEVISAEDAAILEPILKEE